MSSVICPKEVKDGSRFGEIVVSLVSMLVGFHTTQRDEEVADAIFKTPFTEFELPKIDGEDVFVEYLWENRDLWFQERQRVIDVGIVVAPEVRTVVAFLVESEAHTLLLIAEKVVQVRLEKHTVNRERRTRHLMFTKRVNVIDNISRVQFRGSLQWVARSLITREIQA